MMNSKTNQLLLTGKLINGFTYSHEICGEGFYRTTLKVKRLSGNVDLLPVMISERLIDIRGTYDETVQITGQLRSYNRDTEEKHHLELFVFVQDIIEIAGDPEEINDVFLDGFLCKPPVYRETPLGREITDLLIAVNRGYGKSDYIPSIAWGRNARYLSGWKVGDRIQVQGRFQSREYIKCTEDGRKETRTAYELSIRSIK